MWKCYGIMLLLLVGISMGYSQVQTRYFETYILDATENQLVYRNGDELGQVLLDGVLSNKLSAYRMKSFAEIVAFEPEVVNGSILIRHNPEYDTESIVWRESQMYYYGEDVFFEGLIYAAIREEVEGISPDNSEYWEVTPSSLLNPKDLTKLIIDYTDLNGQIQTHYFHFWFYDSYHDEEYYLLSFKAEECMKFLSSVKVTIYEESISSWGWVTGSIFTTDNLSNSNRELATEVLKLARNGKMEYKKLSEPGSKYLAVNIDAGALYENDELGLMKLGSFRPSDLFSLPSFTQDVFGGFYGYDHMLMFIQAAEGTKEILSKDGSFVDGKEHVYFDEAVDVRYKDPFSSLVSVSTTDLSREELEGTFSVIEVNEYDLDYPDNTILIDPGKEIAGLLITGVKTGKIKNLFHDPLLLEPLTKESFIADLAVRDWEMEEEYNNIPFWDDDESYEEYDKIRVSDTVYISEADFNRGNDPENFGGGFWKMDKIMANIETYKTEEFNLLYVVYQKEFDPSGKILTNKVLALQPVVGLRYSIEDDPVTPGYIPIRECQSILSAVKTNVNGVSMNYYDVIIKNKLTGIPIFSGHIRHK